MTVRVRILSNLHVYRKTDTWRHLTNVLLVKVVLLQVQGLKFAKKNCKLIIKKNKVNRFGS